MRSTRRSVSAPCSLTVGSGKEHFDAWNHRENDSPRNDVGRGLDEEGVSDGGAGRSRSVALCSPGILRRQSHVELNSNFVFGPDAHFTGRLDTEVGLFHGGLAGATPVLQHHLYRDWMSLPA